MYLLVFTSILWKYPDTNTDTDTDTDIDIDTDTDTDIDDDDCFYYHSWRNNVVIAFGTLSSFLT